MSDSIRSVSEFLALASKNAEETKPVSSAGNLSQSFQTLLAMSLLGDESGTEDASGLGSSDAMLPLMYSLMEQLIAQQVESGDSSADNASSAMNALSAYSASFNGLADPTAAYRSSSIPSAIPNGLPVTGAITQNYHAGHNGIDIGVSTGTPVKSTMDGKVIYAGWNDQGYGNLVIVENGPYQTYYAHLSDVPVKVGDTVEAGSVIGLSGNTGNSTGPHVHYEVRYQTKAVSPASFA